MMLVGILVLVGALVAVGVGVYQWRKLKMIGGAPLVKSGELVGNANEKGLISVEGQIEMPEPLIAPCSGRACLYYEISVVQRWEKSVATENGRKTQKGKKNVVTEKVGGRFFVNDGSGQAKVDASEGKVSAKLEKAHTEDGPSFGMIHFGQNYKVNVPAHHGDGYATSTQVVEKIIPAEGTAYVAGRLEGDTIMRKKNMGGKLLISKEGAEALQKQTKRKAVGSAVAAALMVPGGGAMTAMGEMPSGSGGGSCAELVGDIESACTGRQTSTDPVEFTWTVEQAGSYQLTSQGTGTDVNYRLHPVIRIRDASGNQVFSASGGGTMPAQGVGVFQPGVYTVSISDTSATWVANLQGGAGFSFDIDAQSLEGAAPTDPAAPAEAAQ